MLRQAPQMGDIAELPCYRQELSGSAFLRISFTVDAVSSAPRFHLCAWMRSFTGAEPGIRSEVGADRHARIYVFKAGGEWKIDAQAWGAHVLSALRLVAGPVKYIANK